ncbi:uncharacterized protein LOC142533785 isoform X1 [Primulina tabacum]|uniref:uncharacterized protein LOC142533785 isoform X1 n=1 Tax=Primulina tabacum TaxID=48773 RepID=UPI003F59BA04
MAYTRFCTSERPRAHQCFCRCPGFTLIFWEDIYGKMPKHMLLRLMDIVGHLMKLRTLKRFLMRDMYVLAERKSNVKDKKRNDTFLPECLPLNVNVLFFIFH